MSDCNVNDIMSCISMLCYLPKADWATCRLLLLCRDVRSDVEMFNSFASCVPL